MSFLTERLFQILDRHSLYARINSDEALRFFMERHVICVWSYSTLLHALHRDLIHMCSPLNSESTKEAMRLIAEIVLAEEVQDVGDGRLMSQMEIYLEAMHDMACDLGPILGFFDILDNGTPPEKAIEQAKFPLEAVRYAKQTISILQEPAHVKAAALFYEGEPFLPDAFLQSLYHLCEKFRVERFLDYFENHVEGLKQPGFSASGRIVEILCGDNHVLLREAERVAEKVMTERADLWNTIARGLDREGMSLPVTPLPATRHLRLVT